MVVDHIIVGNGMLGLTAAYRLVAQDPNARVAVIGPASRPGAATTAAGAMLGVFGEIDGNHNANVWKKAHFDMAYDAGKMWPSFVDELNSQVPKEHQVSIHPNGTYIIVISRGTNEYDMISFEAMVTALEERSEPFEFVPAKDIPGLHPEQSAMSSHALYMPNERSIDPRRVVVALEAALLATGRVDMIDRSVSNLVIGSDLNATGVEFEDGQILEGGTVLLAAGVGCQAIVDKVPELEGRLPRLYVGDGAAFNLDQTNLAKERRINHVIRTPNRAGACGLHVVPKSDDDCPQLYLGAGNFLQDSVMPGASLESSMWIQTCALQEISKHLELARISGVNQGNRPISLDGFPLLGASSTISGLWVTTGTGRDGFHCAPLISKWLAEGMTSQKDPFEAKKTHPFKLFPPERPVIETVTWEESITGAAREAGRALHETGGLMTGGLHVPLPEWLERDVRNIYLNELQTRRALTATVMLPFICRHWSTGPLRRHLASMERAWL